MSSERILEKLNKLRINLMRSVNLVDDLMQELGEVDISLNEELPILPSIDSLLGELEVNIGRNLPILPAIGDEMVEKVSISPSYNKDVEQNIGTVSFSRLQSATPTLPLPPIQSLLIGSPIGSPMVILPPIGSPSTRLTSPRSLSDMAEESIETSPTLSRQNLPVMSTPEDIKFDQTSPLPVSSTILTSPTLSRQNLPVIPISSAMLTSPTLSRQNLPVMPVMSTPEDIKFDQTSPLPVSSTILTSPTLSRQNLPVISSPVLPTSPRTSLSGTRINL